MFAALGATGLLIGVALIACGLGTHERASEQRQERTASSDPSQGSRRKDAHGEQTGASGTQQAAQRPPQFAPTTCWRELERFNDEVTIETFRDWAAPLLASRDPLVRDYLKERLTELIGSDAGRAREVLGWAREAGPLEFRLFTSALKESEAVHLPRVSAQLTEMSLDSRVPLDRRAGLLATLDTQRRFDPAVLGRLADFARDPGSGEAGWAATRTIARVMKTDYQRTGNLQPYLDKLLTIGTESLDEQIRYLAVSTPMDAAPVLDASSTERYAKILTTEGSETGRDAAAHNLSLSQDKAKVLELFAQAFQTEQDVCVRWALFRFAARAAGKDALPVMANMAVIDPRFQPDYQIFERIYASGILDFERVWLSLPSQDPHDCFERD